MTASRCNRPPEPTGRPLVPIAATAAYRVTCAWCGQPLVNDPARPLLRDLGAKPLTGYYCNPEGLTPGGLTA